MVTVAKAMLAADVQRRLVDVAKRTAAEFRAVLAEVCDRLGLTPEQRELAPGAVDEALQRIIDEAGGDDGGPG